MSKTILSSSGIPLSFDRIPIFHEYIEPIDLGPLLLSFYTNDVGGTGFDPAIGTSGLLNWNLGDGSIIIGSNSFTHVYSASGNKNVKIHKGTTDGSIGITSIAMDIDSLVGTLDISSLINLSAFNAGTNADLTQIINPVSSTVYTSYIAQHTGLVGTLDISGLTGLGGAIALDYNPGLTKILNPSSSQTVTTYFVQNCNLTGTLDISGLTGLGGSFAGSYNSGLTKILNPVSAGTFIQYTVEFCDLTGTLDISGLTGLGGYFKVFGNPNLQSILNPISSQIFNSYESDNCNLTGVLDVSGLSKLGGAFKVHNNSNLTSILNPVSDQIFTQYSASQCNLTGVIDLSRLTRLGGFVSFQSNPNLTQVKNSSSNETITDYYVGYCNITGTLDVSGYTNMGGNAFHAEHNPLLTRIINPTTPQLWWTYSAKDCNLTGDLDISGIGGGISGFNVINNPNLTSITLPATITRPIYDLYSFDAINCSLNQATVDDVLEKFYAHFNQTLPTRPFRIHLQSGNSASPTNGWNNSSITGLLNIFNASTAFGIDISVNLDPEIPLLEFTTEASTNSFDPLFTLT